MPIVRTVRSAQMDMVYVDPILAHLGETHSTCERNAALGGQWRPHCLPRPGASWGSKCHFGDLCSCPPHGCAGLGREMQWQPTLPHHTALCEAVDTAWKFLILDIPLLLLSPESTRKPVPTISYPRCRRVCWSELMQRCCHQALKTQLPFPGEVCMGRDVTTACCHSAWTTANIISADKGYASKRPGAVLVAKKCYMLTWLLISVWL